MKVVKVRRERLWEWIEDKYKGIQAGFVEDTGINQGELSALLKDKSFGERKARNIEKMAGMPDGWLDGSPSVVDNNITPAPNPRGLIPVISMVQAGAWAEIVDNFEPGSAEEWVPSFGNHSKHSFAVRVEGISMQNHGHKESFDPGDIVLVDPDLSPDNGTLVIVRLDDRNEATFKKLHIEGEEKYLVPLNPNWPEKIIPINGNATICGVVYQKIVKF